MSKIWIVDLEGDQVEGPCPDYERNDFEKECIIVDSFPLGSALLEIFMILRISPLPKDRLQNIIRLFARHGKIPETKYVQRVLGVAEIFTDDIFDAITECFEAARKMEEKHEEG